MLKCWNLPIFTQLKQKFDQQSLNVIFDLINYLPYGDTIDSLLSRNNEDDKTSLFTVILDWMIILTMFSRKSTNNLILIGNYHSQRIIYLLEMLKFNCLHKYQGERPKSKDHIYDKPPAILPPFPPFI